LHSTKPSFGLYFATAAAANIPFWIYTGIVGFLGLEGDIYLLLMFLMVLLGSVIAGRFLMTRVDSAPLTSGLKAAIFASVVNVLFGIGTFSSEYDYVLILVLAGFFVGIPAECLIHKRGVLRRTENVKSA
jgi:hypothetical protein